MSVVFGGLIVMPPDGMPMHDSISLEFKAILNSILGKRVLVSGSKLPSSHADVAGHNLNCRGV